MEQDGRLAVRIAAFLEVELVRGRNLEPSRTVRDYLREEAQALACLYVTLIHVVAILHDGALVGE
jgi:hypothetical protein